MTLFLIILQWSSMFGIFVPFGYLDWWFAVPLSIGCFLIFVNTVLLQAKEKINETK